MIKLRPTTIMKDLKKPIVPKVSVSKKEGNAIVGGFSTFRPMETKITNMLVGLEDQVQVLAGTSFKYIKPLGFTQQVVAGMRYKVKVDTDMGVYLVTLVEPLPFTGKQPFVQIVEKQE